MRTFIIPEQQLMIIIKSAADASLAEGKSFTNFELTLALDFVAKMPKVFTITSDQTGETKNGN